MCKAMIQKEFIRNELRYRYPDLADSIRFPQQSVGRPLLFEGGVRKFGARIIVCSGEEMNTLSGSAQREPLFLCIGAPTTKILNEYDVCVLPASEQAGAVLNFVQRLFDRLDDWTQSLRQAAETGEGVEELLSRASAMLQNPVVLLDERGHIIAQSEQADVASISERFYSDKLLETASQSGSVYRVGSAATEIMVSRLQSGESQYLLLCLASDRPLYASDEIVLESLAGFLRLMLSERTLRLGTHRQLRGNEAAAVAFRSLLLQDEGEQNAPELLRKLDWYETDEYAVLVVEPINGDLRAAQADAICDRLETALEGCCSFALLPVVVAVVRTDAMENDALYEALKTIADSNELHIGICEAYTGFPYFPQRIEQAKRALNRAEKFGGAARYSDVFEFELPLLATAEFPNELLCMRSVLALSRYDRMHDTNYQETAEAYVKNRFNAVRTAGELFIHRSTFLYRLERIKAQFGLDLDDKELSMLHLLFSLRIARDL